MRLTDNKLLSLIEEQEINIDTEIKGKVIYGDIKTKSIRKFELNFQNVGKKRGLRVIAVVTVVHNLVIILHVYAKSKKKDMSPEEYVNLREVFDSF